MFFFSSRRRHTRCLSDWSSDVCSSDLMSAVMAAPWAHWQYTPAQWESWAKNQLAWERSSAGALTWRKSLVLVLFCVALFAFGALFSGAGLRENVVIVAGLSAFVT